MLRRTTSLLVFAAACGSPSTVGPSLAPHTASTLPASPPSATASVPPVVGKARIDLAFRKPTHMLGENVLVDFCVVNTDAAPITLEVGGDYRGSSRSLRFKVQVKDAAGNVMADPDPNPMNFGGMGYSPDIKPGDRWCQSLQLMRYARIEAPGTYTVTATHDLGWKGETPPTGTATVSFTMPDATQAEAVVAAMQALPEDPSTSAGKRAMAFQDFSALAYDVYTAPLAARAQRGVVNAFQGLTMIPTKNATSALIKLLSVADPKTARAAAQALAMRLPDPALTGALGKRNPFENSLSEQRKFLSSRAWDAAFADDVRIAAKKRLASADEQDQKDGAFMIEAVGTIADAPDLVKALEHAIDRTRTQPAEANVYPVPRGACQELLRAADMLVARGLAPAATPKTVGDIAVWLVAMHAGARPAGWEAELDRAMKHPTAFVRQLALERAPDALPASLVPTVAANLSHADEDVVVAAAELARRANLKTLTKDLVKAMAKPTGLRLNIVSYAAHMLGARMDRANALVVRLGDKAAFDEALSELVDTLDYHGRSSNGEVSDATRVVVAAKWAAFVRLHKADIEADRKISLTDKSVTPDLVPKEWKLGRGDGTEWP